MLFGQEESIVLTLFCDLGLLDLTKQGGGNLCKPVLSCTFFAMTRDPDQLLVNWFVSKENGSFFI